MARRSEQHASEVVGHHDVEPALKTHALATLERSLRWYRTAAGRARAGYWASESVLLVVAAAIAASAAITADQGLPAIVGALVVVLTGLRTVFRWQEDWLGFTQACARLETERAFYEGRVGEYAGDDRDQRLIQRVREIEAAETATWATMRRSPKGERPPEPARGQPASGQ